MIDLLAREDRSGFGIACALEIERIPYRRIGAVEDATGRLLVVPGSEVSPAVLARAVHAPTVMVGVPAAPPEDIFGVAGGTVVGGEARISLDEAIWPVYVRAAARRFGKTALRIPCASTFWPDRSIDDAALATLQRGDGGVQPAILRRGRCLWSLVDLGAAFAQLLDEGYLPPGRSRPPRPLPRPALHAYYRVPEPIRQTFQRRVYRRLQAGLARQATPSEYPVDATGWLLLELLKQLIRTAAGGLVRLARWPAPYVASATLTHDLEPTRFAYTQGLDALLGNISESGHPPTFGVVAGPAGRHLTQRGSQQLQAHEILCHGLEHRGETLGGSREETAAGLGAAKASLERQFNRPIVGFRSPRLDRSADLLWALEKAGFRYDSSYPDVDRENMTHFGAGVRLNLPYRPPLEDGNAIRPSGCLELPVSSPDCIQPLFEGDDVRTLRRAVREKIAFVHATGGLYVGIIHAGVFGVRDALRRGSHLAFVGDELRRPDVWLATLNDVAEWWLARELVTVSFLGERVQVSNQGERTIERVRLIVESGEREAHYDIASLAPGEDVTFEMHPPQTEAQAS